MTARPVPGQTLGEFLEMLGERPAGWFAYPVMIATLRQAPSQWYSLAVLTPRQYDRLRTELEEAAPYPVRIETARDSAGMVHVRATTVRHKVTESIGPPISPRARGWEASPGQWFDPGPQPNVDYVEGDEHDPNLGVGPDSDDD